MKRGSIFHTLIAGWGERPTRFHDEKGNMVPLSGMWYLPDTAVTTILRKVFGYLPPRPWFSYRAQRTIAQILCPDAVVLEFGSGMSTPWFARHCESLYSIEHDPVWYHRVKASLTAAKVNNVHYMLRDKTHYADLSGWPDQFFDFILVDGMDRPTCIRNSIEKLKRGGWIYLDNTDRIEYGKSGNEYRQAEELLNEITRRCHGSFEYYTDFVPATSVAKQGMLVHL